MKIYNFQENVETRDQDRVYVIERLGMTACYLPNIWKFYGYLNGTLMAIPSSDKIQSAYLFEEFEPEAVQRW